MKSATRRRIEYFFDEDGCTLSYLVVDGATQHCAIVGSVLATTPSRAAPRMLAPIAMPRV